MKRISLISNSSIQYHKFESDINLDFAKNNKVYFHQPFDSNILDFTLDPLFKVSIDGWDVGWFSKFSHATVGLKRR